MRRWAVAIGCGAVAVAAAGCVQTVAGTAKPGPGGGGLDAILLSADEIKSVVGATDIAVVDSSRDMQSTDEDVSRPDCLGALYNAEDSVYRGSGWTDVSDQVLANPEDNHWVEQTAVEFVGQDPARAFLTASLIAWSHCSGKEVTLTGGGDVDRWDIGDLIISGQTINQTARQQGGSGWGCQHALSAAAAVVIEASACGTTIGDEAVAIVEKMAANVS